MSRNKACSERFIDLIPRYHAKRLIKLEPSPIVLDAEGIGGIIEAGKFSDVWAPREYRNRKLYIALFHATLKPSPSDPPTVGGAFIIAWYGISLSICSPLDQNVDWSNCQDSQYEACSAGTPAYLNYTKCHMAQPHYGPYMYILNASPSSTDDETVISAHAKPCPVASAAPQVAGKPLMSSHVLLRALGCQDTANKLFYTRFSAEDRTTQTYTIAGGAMGSGTSTKPNYLLVYTLPSSTTKGATDVYYYIYHIGVPYG